VDESNVAPAGSWDADSVIVLAGSKLVAMTVKLIHTPDLTVWFLGRASAGGRNACTSTVMLAKRVAWGRPESVIVRVTV
jgi:hypothetical protein